MNMYKDIDWSKASSDYAKYRDIYPKEFYEYILDLGLCKDHQVILDVGTGTGVLPRNMYQYGGKWIASDVSKGQIEQAKLLAKGMDIDFFVSKAEDIHYPDHTFDVITACQCIWYLDPMITAKSFAGMLKDDGSFLVLYMGWLPYEDEIAGKSEKLILKYNPKWDGSGDTMHPVYIAPEYDQYFDLVSQEQFKVDVSFTRDSWHGRMRVCKGTSVSMEPEVFALWNKEHHRMLLEYPETFTIKHYISIAYLKKKRLTEM